jgi:hypothetical protein
MSKPGDRAFSFIDRVLAGRARLGDIDDYIDEWHNADDDSLAATVELHEYLGLTWDEYRLWVERPESLRFTIAARRANQPVEKVLEQTRMAGAAARSTEHTEAANVLQWLARTGRIGTSRKK